ncbi:MAG: hypothetical protein NC831_08790 [Candidatus Omnitrophica bacterium]|nr:hypothetical protein [Candidatus Omnitrophota bacterium]MCM8828833.1 hypothetical protein [Candidatus Omnitrophota bacterium]
MKRALNYTERKKIKRENISISFRPENGVPDGFILNRLDLADLNLPSNAKVFVEAYYRTEVKRFDFGTVDNISFPVSTDFSGMSYKENIKFRILVVDPRDHRLLAHADRIVPVAFAEMKSILPVEFKDLRKELWRIEYEGDMGAPILCINNKIPNVENMARQDPQFFVCVYPVVVREILMRIVFIEEVGSIYDSSINWINDWLKFCINLGTSPPETLNHTDERFDKDVSLEWIDNVVIAFCQTYGSKFQDYLRKLEEYQ